MNSQTQAPTASDVHGHEILQAIHLARPPFDRAALAQFVRGRFGPAATFRTCSAGGMTLDQLLHLLVSRGKVIESPGGRLATDLSKVCKDGGGLQEHDHDHDD